MVPHQARRRRDKDRCIGNGDIKILRRCDILVYTVYPTNHNYNNMSKISVSGDRFRVVSEIRNDNRLLVENGKNEQRSNRTYVMYYEVQVDT
jgi:hypothetical protein